MNKTSFRLYLLCACGAVAFFCLLQNLGTVFGWLGEFIAVLRPFVLGGILAFILNIPLARIRPLLSKGWFEKHPGAANLLSVAAVYLLAFGLVTGIVLFIVPPFVESIRTFSANLEQYYLNALAAVNGLSTKVDPELWARLGIAEKLNQLYRNLPALLEKAVAFCAQDSARTKAAKDGTCDRTWVRKTLLERNCEIIEGCWKP